MSRGRTPPLKFYVERLPKRKGASVPPPPHPFFTPSNPTPTPENNSGSVCVLKLTIHVIFFIVKIKFGEIWDKWDIINKAVDCFVCYKVIKNSNSIWWVTCTWSCFLLNGRWYMHLRDMLKAMGSTNRLADEK